MRLSSTSCCTCRTRTVMILVSMLLVCLMSSVACAAPWAVVANRGGAISTIELGGTPTAYGPFLKGQFGFGFLSDTAVTPDGKYAVVTDSFSKIMYRIDLTDMKNPVLSGYIALTMAPQDVAISPDGSLAVVSDTLYSGAIAFVDMAGFRLKRIYQLGVHGGKQAGSHAVAIAPDNKTVIVCDNYNNRIIYGAINEAGDGLASASVIATGIEPRNVEFSPDGKTALVVSRNKITVLEVTGTGVVVAKASIDAVPGTIQSVAFTPDGQKAYLLSKGTIPETLTSLTISGPGEVTVDEAQTRLLWGGQNWFGAETLAVTYDGKHALATNGNNGQVAVVDLATLQITPLSIDSISMGVAAVPNRLPTINGTPDATVYVDDEYNFTPSGADADGDLLTYSITNKPVWAEFDPATGSLSGTPTATQVGLYSDIVISVSDGIMSAALPPFDIAVRPMCNVPGSLTVPATSGTGKFSIYWSSSATPGVTYELQESINNGVFATKWSGSSTNAPITVTLNGKYAYRVKAKKEGYKDSAFTTARLCNVELACTVPGSLTVPVRSATGKFSVYWSSNAIPGATYVLEQSFNSGAFAEIWSGTSTNVPITVTQNGTYAYRVKATKAGYKESPFTVARSCTVELTCSVPSSLTVPAVNGTGKFSVYWNPTALPGVVYELEQKIGAGSFMPIYSGSSTRYEVMVPATGSYTYRVKATKEGYKDSVYSASKTCNVF